MKRRMSGIMSVALAAGLVVLLGGCATTMPQGTIFTGVTLPQAATGSTAGASKIGTAQCMSIMGAVAFGNASIEAAAANGGITKIHHVDWEVKNILGVYGRYKCVVYGE